MTDLYLDDVHIYRDDRWVGAAAPTHGGFCANCPNQRTEPTWSWIDMDGTPRRSPGFPCHGCLAWNSGWVLAGMRRMPTHGIEAIGLVVADADAAAFIEGLEIEVAGLRLQEWARMRAQLRDKLRQVLVPAAADMPDGPPEENDEAWDRWRWAYNVDLSPGGDGPLYFDDDGVLWAWAVDPADPSAVVEVSAKVRT